MSMTATGLIIDALTTLITKHDPSTQTEISKEVDCACAENCNEDAENITQGEKRKIDYCHEELDSGSQSRGALKRLAGATVKNDDTSDGIFSNEDFQRIKVLKAKKEAELALNCHGIKIPSAEELSLKRVDGYSLEANIRKKMTKEERVALVKAGREDTGKYKAKAAIKRQKTGGLSNRQKEQKKAMPLAAKRLKIQKLKSQKKMKQWGAGKQFGGRKAWK
ncbi:protein SDA1 homolog isoform X2 [Tanacetum coccineum]